MLGACREKNSNAKHFFFFAFPQNKMMLRGYNCKVKLNRP